MTSIQAIPSQFPVGSPSYICKTCDSLLLFDLISMSPSKLKATCISCEKSEVFQKISELNKIYSQESMKTCSKCGWKSDTDSMSICRYCRKIFCVKCKSIIHKKCKNFDPIFVKYRSIHFTCLEHNKTFSAFCPKCKRQKCEECDDCGHSKDFEDFRYITPSFRNSEEIYEKIKVQMDFIKFFKDEIKKYIKDVDNMLNQYIGEMEAIAYFNYFIHKGNEVFKNSNYSILKNFQLIIDNNFDFIKKINREKFMMDTKNFDPIDKLKAIKSVLDTYCNYEDELKKIIKNNSKYKVNKVVKGFESFSVISMGKSEENSESIQKKDTTCEESEESKALILPNGNKNVFKVTREKSINDKKIEGTNSSGKKKSSKKENITSLEKKAEPKTTTQIIINNNNYLSNHNNNYHNHQNRRCDSPQSQPRSRTPYYKPPYPKNYNKKETAISKRTNYNMQKELVRNLSHSDINIRSRSRSSSNPDNYIGSPKAEEDVPVKGEKVYSPPRKTIAKYYSYRSSTIIKCIKNEEIACNKFCITHLLGIQDTNYLLVAINKKGCVNLLLYNFDQNLEHLFSQINVVDYPPLDVIRLSDDKYLAMSEKEITRFTFQLSTFDIYQKYEINERRTKFTKCLEIAPKRILLIKEIGMSQVTYEEESKSFTVVSLRNWTNVRVLDCIILNDDYLLMTAISQSHSNTLKGRIYLVERKSDEMKVCRKFFEDDKSLITRHHNTMIKIPDGYALIVSVEHLIVFDYNNPQIKQKIPGEYGYGILDLSTEKSCEFVVFGERKAKSGIDVYLQKYLLYSEKKDKEIIFKTKKIGDELVFKKLYGEVKVTKGKDGIFYLSNGSMIYKIVDTGETFTETYTISDESDNEK